MKHFSAFALTFSAILAAPVHAQSPSSPTVPEKPKLIVALAVDQLSSDLFTQYRQHFTGGFKRLSQGVVFPRGHQSHAATETCPGHSTLLTGSRPARNGIIANEWQNPREPRRSADGKVKYDVYCAEDPKATSASGPYVVSHQFLKVPTMGDRMKVVAPDTQIVSVSGKDRAAVMMGGHHADLAMWWNGKAFVTYDGSTSRLPPRLAAINAAAQAGIAKPVVQKLPPACQPVSLPVAIGKDASVGTLAPRKPGNVRAWMASPDLDSATLDVALAAMEDRKLGMGATTDLLAISFSATDYVGHGFGTEGAETCHELMMLDAILARLFAALDKRKISYAVVLSSDHGGHDLPERNRQQGLPAAQRVDIGLSAAMVGAKLARQFGLASAALIGRSPFGDMYLSPDIPADKRAAVLDAALATYRAHPQVEAVLTAAELSAAPAPSGAVDEWTLLERFKASFDPERSGDFLVALKPYVTPIPDAGMGYVATHGSPWGYDRRVPMLFWWKGVNGFEQPNAVETVDILPTLASLIGLTVPAAEIDGRCLDLVAGVNSNCPQ